MNYDACDVTLSVYPHRASLKNMPDHGGNNITSYICMCMHSITVMNFLWAKNEIHYIAVI